VPDEAEDEADLLGLAEEPENSFLSEMFLIASLLL